VNQFGKKKDYHYIRMRGQQNIKITIKVSQKCWYRNK